MNITWSGELYQSKYCRIIINASEKLNGKQIIQIENQGTSEMFIYEQANAKWYKEEEQKLVQNYTQYT